MASAASTGTSTPIRQHNRECPVCFRVFRIPKILRCGHSVCAECADHLKSPIGSIECPVCRAHTSAVGGLPTNFALQNLIEEAAQERPKHSCEECSRRHPLEEMWSCKTCSLTVACANCIVKAHRDHDVQGLKDLLESRQAEFEETRRSIETTYQDFTNRQLEMETSLRHTHRLFCNSLATLQNHVLPLINTALRDGTTASNVAIQGVRAATLSNLTATGRYDTYLKETPRIFHKMTDKQERIKRDIALVQDLVRNTSDVMQNLMCQFRQGVGGEEAMEVSSGTSAENGSANATVSGSSPAAQGLSAFDWPIDEALESRNESRPAHNIPGRRSETRDLANALPSSAVFFAMVESELGEAEEPEPDDIAHRQQLVEVNRILEQRLGNRAAVVFAPRSAAAASSYRPSGGYGRGTPVNDSPTSSGPLGGVGRGSGGRGRGRGFGDDPPPIGVVHRVRMTEGTMEAQPSTSGALPFDDLEEA